jgi:lipopolysaccharide heptosyltransferase II
MQNFSIHPSKIIVRLPSWVGDTVMAVPFLHTLREIYPDSHITAAGKKWVISLFHNFPHIDDLWEIDPGDVSSPSFSMIKKLRREKFDLGFLLTNSFRSALIFYAGNVKKRVGYNLDMRRFLLNQAVKADQAILEKHMVEYYLNLLSPFTDISKHEIKMKLYPREKEREEVKKLLLENGWDGKSSLIGINPFAFQWTSKRWPHERFAELTNILMDKFQVQCVFSSVEKDRPLFEKIQKLCTKKLIDMVGKIPLSHVPALMENYKLFVTNDSGLMHVAATMDTPVVAIFGSTDFKRTSPYSKKTILIRKDQDHPPCMNPECTRSFKCMLDICVEEVVEAVEKFL